ncbi:MAG: iron chaperone [Actinomycetota bacterium]
MAGTKKKSTQRSAKSTKKGTTSSAFTAEERAAMKELAAERRRVSNNADGESDVLAKIAEMRPSDRVMAKRIHEMVKTTAPSLSSRTWYGMPAYTKDGKVVCFFKSAGKFKSRYATFGFEETAHLDDGTMWVTSYALTELTPADEKKLAALVKKAVR